MIPGARWCQRCCGSRPVRAFFLYALKQVVQKHRSPTAALQHSRLRRTARCLRLASDTLLCGEHRRGRTTGVPLYKCIAVVKTKHGAGNTEHTIPANFAQDVLLLAATFASILAPWMSSRRKDLLTWVAKENTNHRSV